MGYFFIWCLAATRPTLDHYRGEILTYPMLITEFVKFWPAGQWEPHNDDVGYLSPFECIVWFELGTFRFLLQCLTGNFKVSGETLSIFSLWIHHGTCQNRQHPKNELKGQNNPKQPEITQNHPKPPKNNSQSTINPVLFVRPK